MVFRTNNAITEFRLLCLFRFTNIDFYLYSTRELIILYTDELEPEIRNAHTRRKHLINSNNTNFPQKLKPNIRHINEVIREMHQPPKSHTRICHSILTAYRIKLRSNLFYVPSARWGRREAPGLRPLCRTRIYISGDRSAPGKQTGSSWAPVCT